MSRIDINRIHTEPFDELYWTHQHDLQNGMFTIGSLAKAIARNALDLESQLFEKEDYAQLHAMIDAVKQIADYHTDIHGRLNDLFTDKYPPVSEEEEDCNV